MRVDYGSGPKNEHGNTEEKSAACRAFAERYVVDFNGTQSARDLGEKHWAAEYASRFLHNPETKAHIRLLLDVRTAEFDDMRKRIIAELSRIAFAGESSDKDKVAALGKLMTHMGMDAPVKVDLSGDLSSKSLSELLAMRSK